MAHLSDAQLSSWCQQWLGSQVEQTLFRSGNLSQVSGARLADGREVVVKQRPWHGRLAGCAAVHESLWQQGFPCPKPLAGPVRVQDLAISAELMLAGGQERSDSATPFASLLARLIRQAPAADTVPDLTPPPPWTYWYHDFDEIWPPADDRPDDLNADPEPAWLNGMACLVRQRLAHLRGAARVIGHGDWESHNLRFGDGGQPWAVHDWDSVVAEPETVIVGVAAAMWPASATCSGASLAQTGEFLTAYQMYRGTPFRPEQVQEAWAAGVWVRAFNAKKSLLDGHETLSRAEATERLRLADALP